MFAFSLGYPEMLMIGLFGVLLFGKRLPEVGRSLGKGLVEFKKGIAGVEDNLTGNDTMSSYTSTSSTTTTPERAPDRIETSVPKFEPPASA
ncbi:MAG: twin-arginine translocase TatA/TatE family subunit [Isosphaeraceae bacterium]